MARPLRIEFPGALYLVTARTLPRQKLIRNADEVAEFVSRLPGLSESFGAVFHGFCLMPDHYHLLLETPLGNLSRILHRLNAGYTATLNSWRKRRGPLLQSRYRSILIDEDPWLVRLSVHTHLNPVRKRLTRDPWTYTASSARAFAPGGNPIPGIETGRVVALAGGREAYFRLVGEAFRDPPPAPWNEVWRQVVLGGERLRQLALAAMEGKDSREITGFSENREGLSLDQVVQVVSDNTGAQPSDILRGKYQRVLARKVGLYLVRRFTGLTLREIGEVFGVDYTTVHMATRRLEELRAKDPAVDEFVTALEGELRRLLPQSRSSAGAQGKPKAKPRTKPSAETVEKQAGQLRLF